MPAFISTAPAWLLVRYPRKITLPGALGGDCAIAYDTDPYLTIWDAAGTLVSGLLTGGSFLLSAPDAGVTVVAGASGVALVKFMPSYNATRAMGMWSVQVGGGSPGYEILKETLEWGGDYDTIMAAATALPAVKAKTDTIVAGGATASALAAVAGQVTALAADVGTGGSSVKALIGTPSEGNLADTLGAIAALLNVNDGTIAGKVDAVKAVVDTSKAMLVILKRLGLTREEYSSDFSKLNVYELSGGALLGWFPITYDAPTGKLKTRGEFVAAP